ncbi:hypothetical protein [Bradyrhizobium sp. UFLA05-112]
MVVALLVLTGATSAAWAQSHTISGHIGYLHEWEIAGSIAKAATHQAADYSGAVTLRHVGLCSVNGVEQKQARVQLKVSSGRLEGTLIMDDDECRIVASGASGSGLLTCRSGQGIPIDLLIGNAVATEASNRAGPNP